MGKQILKGGKKDLLASVHQSLKEVSETDLKHKGPETVSLKRMELVHAAAPADGMVHGTLTLQFWVRAWAQQGPGSGCTGIFWELDGHTRQLIRTQGDGSS